ncbi:MAG TPA: T9SS type A sorting domain-containing protein [Ignavibacteria bacterium]
MIKKTIYLTLLLFLFYDYANADDSVKVMCYNLLNYGFSADPRDINYRKIVRSANPDILTVEEIVSQEGVDEFLDSVMNYYTPELYNAGTFINGTDTDNGIFYKPSKFIFISNTPIIVPVTGARDMNVFKLRHIITNREILIISLHLKSGSEIQYQQQRAAEVLALRQFTDSLPYGTNFIVQGDCNLQGATEQAYINLTIQNPNADGHCIDPLNLPGIWNKNPAYALYHTQSTRIRSFGGGSIGGLDDRFDLILYSRSISSGAGISYIQGSYKVFGNDGNHFNDSINRRPNTAVPDSIADALHYASDHLPVSCLFLFQTSSGVININSEFQRDFVLYQNFPNPFNPATNIKFSILKAGVVSLKIFDNRGKKIYELFNKRFETGSYQQKLEFPDLPNGVYFYRLQTNNHVETKKMIFLK